MPRVSKKLAVAEFPEKVGVSSAETEKFIEDLKDSKIEYHSVMILRHGKIAFEGHRYPFGRDVPHAMYSVSKSFISIAIGFAIDEGLISLDTRVIDIFPAYRLTKQDEKIERLTVYHLLTMTSGKDVSVFSDKTSYYWVRDFFKARWYAEPGEKWKYISENTYMCAAIIQKVTGMGVREYLKPRLFEPLGINRIPQWETDREGLEAGGWGLYITPEELAKFILCVQNGGRYAGKQVIPQWYAEKATEFHIPCTQFTDENASAGYGMFFWMSKLENCPRADGMFSQFGLMFKDYDATLIFTGSEVDEKKTKDCIFRHFPDIFIEETDEKPSEEYKFDFSPMPVLPASKRSVMENFIGGKKIKFIKNPILNAAGFPVSVLSFPAVYMSADKCGNIDDVVFEFKENECVFSWTEGTVRNSVCCGMDGKPRISGFHLMGIDFTAYSTAAWSFDGALELQIRPVETVNARILRFEFKGKRVLVLPETTPSSGAMLSGFTNGIGETLPGKKPANILRKASGGAGIVLDQPLIGKLV